MIFKRGLLALLACTAAFAQVQFEVASIRPSEAPSAADRVNIGVHVDGSRISCNFLSLKDYIRMAYQVKDYQIIGQEWIAGERFNISATLPEGATQAQVPEMLKTLLADRFQVKLHHDKKEFPVYALVVAKTGLKIKESPDYVPPAGEEPRKSTNVTGGGGRGGVNINFGNGSSFTFANNRLNATKLTMTNFADMLARFEDRPVVDMTELKGGYDFDLEFSAEDYNAMLIRSAIAAGVVLPPEALKMLEGSSGDTLRNSLEKLGLKLETRKAPLEVLIIDSASKVPTEN